MYIATRRAHLEAREAGFLVKYNSDVDFPIPYKDYIYSFLDTFPSIPWVCNND